jgi:tetratricopeptide (TPR) repeat protein
MSDQSLINWIRHPASIILIVAIAIMFVMLTDQSHRQNKQNQASSAVPVSPSSPSTTPSENTNPPALSNKTDRVGGGELPKIVQNLNGGGSMSPPSKAAPGRLTAPDLGSLLGRLEEKVKAQPDNVNNRLLLAQTYNELGMTEKAIKVARSAKKQFPDHFRTKLVLASVLSKQQDEGMLREAIQLLTGLKKNQEVKQYLVDMYLGDASIRLGDHAAAVENWKMALKGMPIGDNRRARIEKAIADVSSGETGA